MSFLFLFVMVVHNLDASIGFIFLLLVFITLTHNKAEDVLVKTTNGPVIGETVTIREHNGNLYFNVFRSIRYARKPLRFQVSEEPIKWSEPVSAKELPPPCIQTGNTLPLKSNLTPTEDCLFLNVFYPHKESSGADTNEAGQSGKTSLLPVMFWIHGGAFQFGDTEFFGTDFVLQNVVSRGVILVTVQFRLGPYGFFSTGDASARGNWAFSDVTLALRWVQGNIRGFGGDPGKVTIFGESSGGTMTSLLTLSPPCYDLFHAAIIMSNSNQMTDFATNSRPFATAQRVARNLGCPIESGSSLVDCVKQKSPDELTKAYLNGLAPTIREAHEMRPVIDNVYLPKPIAELYKEMPKRPVIIGITGLEGARHTFIMPPYQKRSRFSFDPRNLTDFSYENFERAINESLPDSNFKRAAVLRKVAVQHYLFNGDRSNVSFLFQQYTQKAPRIETPRWLFLNSIAHAHGQTQTESTGSVIGWNMLMSDVRWEMSAYFDAQERLNLGHNVWLYRLDYYNSAMFHKDLKFLGAFHSADLTYIFDYKIVSPFESNEEDAQMTRLFCDFFANFAKTGVPGNLGIDGLNWKPVSPEEPLSFLSLTLKPEVKPDFAAPTNRFWAELVPELENLDACGKDKPTSYGEHRRNYPQDRQWTFLFTVTVTSAIISAL